MNKYSGLVMARASSAVPSDIVQQPSSLAADSLQNFWVYFPGDGEREFAIRNSGGYLCLTAPTNTGDLNDRWVTFKTCTPIGYDQYWQAIAIENTGQVRIRHQATGLYLSVYGLDGNSGTRLCIWEDTNTENQHWFLVPLYT
jgi:hypothetical protein